MGRNISYSAICTEFYIAYVFVGCRFAVAALTLLLISFKSMKGVTLKDLGAGSVIGLVIVGGYGTQTIGLQTIPSSESAF